MFVFIAGACGPRKEILPGTFIIEGDALESKVYFTLEEIQSMEEGLIEADYFSLNSYGTKEYFHFKGIWLGYLLQEKVSLKDHASEVTFIAEDDYTVKLTLADTLKEDYIDEQNPEIKHKVILAWEEDGREYDPQKGNPFSWSLGNRAMCRNLLGEIPEPSDRLGLCQRQRRRSDVVIMKSFILTGRKGLCKQYNCFGLFLVITYCCLLFCLYRGTGYLPPEQIMPPDGDPGYAQPLVLLPHVRRPEHGIPAEDYDQVKNFDNAHQLQLKLL